MKVTFLLGSKSDTEYAEKIVAVLNEFDVPSEIVVASAHKVPEKVIEEVEKLNADPQPQVVITVVGMSNGQASFLRQGRAWWATNSLPFGASIAHPGSYPLYYEASLQFGHGAKNRKDHLARWCAGINLL